MQNCRHRDETVILVSKSGDFSVQGKHLTTDECREFLKNSTGPAKTSGQVVLFFADGSNATAFDIALRVCGDSGASRVILRTNEGGNPLESSLMMLGTSEMADFTHLPWDGKDSIVIFRREPKKVERKDGSSIVFEWLYLDQLVNYHNSRVPVEELTQVFSLRPDTRVIISASKNASAAGIIKLLVSLHTSPERIAWGAVNDDDIREERVKKGDP